MEGQGQLMADNDNEPVASAIECGFALDSDAGRGMPERRRLRTRSLRGACVMKWALQGSNLRPPACHATIPASENAYF